EQNRRIVCMDAKFHQASLPFDLLAPQDQRNPIIFAVQQHRQRTSTIPTYPRLSSLLSFSVARLPVGWRKLSDNSALLADSSLRKKTHSRRSEVTAIALCRE